MSKLQDIWPVALIVAIWVLAAMFGPAPTHDDLCGPEGTCAAPAAAAVR
jgi:hypothetical protein